MAIEAKADFLRQLEAELSANIPAAQLSVVLATASDVLEGYDMRTAFGNSFAEHDDLLESYISAMNVQGRSQKTIDRYRYMIQRMLEQVKDEINPVSGSRKARLRDAVDDAIALLKEQEPVKPCVAVDTWICPKCGHALESQSLIDDKENPQVLVHELYSFCPNCGKTVNWDDA